MSYQLFDKYNSDGTRQAVDFIDLRDALALRELMELVQPWGKWIVRYERCGI